MSEPKIVRYESHSYHVTAETDHGVLDAGLAQGYRFITTKTGCGGSWEEAEADLAKGGSLTGYRVVDP